MSIIKVGILKFLPKFFSKNSFEIKLSENDYLKETKMTVKIVYRDFPVLTGGSGAKIVMRVYYRQETNEDGKIISEKVMDIKFCLLAPDNTLIDQYDDWKDAVKALDAYERSVTQNPPSL